LCREPHYKPFTICELTQKTKWFKRHVMLSSGVKLIQRV
jgi:hypothetical protein